MFIADAPALDFLNSVATPVDTPSPAPVDPSDTTERITRFDSDITVVKNGTMTVAETIAVNAQGEQINHGMHSVPTILFPDGTVLVEPAFAQLSAKLMPYSEQESQED